jgi:Protein of unknown function (DUF2889)
MPLSAPAERELLHLRDIVLRGYQRADGLFDIEAHLLDTKSYGYENADRGWMEPGEPLHGMWMRMTVDQDMVITACEAATDHSPYSICPQAAPNFSRLAGIRIGPGFTRAVKERVGGVQGCTHLREMLGQMATVAFQTLYSVRVRRESEERERIAAGRVTAGDGLAAVETAPKRPARKPSLIGTCLAYAPDSLVVRQRWPHLDDTAD